MPLDFDHLDLTLSDGQHSPLTQVWHCSHGGRISDALMAGRLPSANNNAATFITEQRLADEATLVWSRESNTHAEQIMAFVVLRDESKDNPFKPPPISALPWLRLRLRYKITCRLWMTDRITVFCEQLWHFKTQLNITPKRQLFDIENSVIWKLKIWRSHFAKRRCHNAITHAWLRPCPRISHDIEIVKFHLINIFHVSPVSLSRIAGIADTQIFQFSLDQWPIPWP